ncbi:MAG: sulfotransferase family protein, partial [Bacteroidota bacterium]
TIILSWTECLTAIEEKNAPLHPHVPPGDFHNNLLISPHHNYVFANNPKVACTTTRKLLIDAEFGEVRPFVERADILHYKEFLPFLNVWQMGDFPAFVANPAVFKFCFVRNPYTRLLSGYLDKIVRGEPQKQNILEFIGKADDPNTEIDFPTFVRTVCEMPVLKQDPHWRVQYYQTYQDGIDYDFIGKFENLEADLRAAADRIGIADFITPTTFGAAGKSSRGHATEANKSVQRYYTPELRDTVRQAFSKDFVSFGYDESLPS